VINAADAAAAGLLGGLTPRDRRLLRSWRQAGFDLTDAMLASGVLVGSGARRHPADVEVRDAMAEHLRSIAPVTESLIVRQSAEHESAHAICAQAIGFTVGVMAIERSVGVTRWTTRRDASPIEIAAVIAAPAVTCARELATAPRLSTARADSARPQQP
jgi:hypothetical protein